jgi:MFS superfamily sulfate permease-like transporter
MKWLNETFPTRVLVAFGGGLAVVVFWKALERLIG